MKVEKLEEKGFISKEKTIKIEAACKGGFLIILPIVILMIGAYFLINGGYDITVQPWTDYFIIAGMFIGGFAIHEFLHGITWVIVSEDKWKSIRRGLDINYMKPYINCEEAVKVSEYRIQKLLPVIITAIIPYIIAIITGNYHLAIASSFLFGMCGVDLKILLLLRKENKNSYIINHYDDSIYGGIIYDKK